MLLQYLRYICIIYYKDRRKLVASWVYNDMTLYSLYFADDHVVLIQDQEDLLKTYEFISKTLFAEYEASSK